MNLMNENAKEKYEYQHYWYDEITEELLKYILSRFAKSKRSTQHNAGTTELYNRTERVKIGSGKYCKTYLNVPCGFDIETTTKYAKDENGKVIDAFGTMYVWQFSIGNVVIMGWEWFQFLELLTNIKNIYQPTPNSRLIVWIHNASYEFAFLRKWINITESFLKEQRHVLTFTHDDFIMFRDSQAMTNSSLKKLAEDYTNTQKCVGDLDYSVERSSVDAKRLTSLELSYCHNDVLILAEWSTYYYNTYIRTKKLPLTISATLRDEMKTELENYNVDLKIIQSALPPTEEFYVYLTNWVYRGGFTHADETEIEKIFTIKDNIHGVDFTSSYPSVMALGYFPFKFRRVSKPTIQLLNDYCKTYCVVFTATFSNIHRTTTQSIESKFKCIELDGESVDNGRIRSAKKMKVALTELDYESYCEFYDWDYMIVNDMWVAERVNLPKYILKPMIKYYYAKSHNKELGLPYGIEKAKVNTFYGVMVQKRCVESIKYFSGLEWVDGDVPSYKEWKENQFLLTQHGVYVSAHARRNLLKCVYKITKNPTNDTPVLYCDTDSIKILHFDNYCKKVIEDYNADVKKKLGIFKSRFNLGKEFDDLGMFDGEFGTIYHTPVVAFKTLGCKRYMISYWKANKKTGVNEICHTQTIAGLPKNYLFRKDKNGNFLITGNKNYYDVYKKFEDGMKIKCCKTTAFYNDDVDELNVNGHLQKELSNVALVPIDFTMTINEMWRESILTYLESEKTKEKRVK